MLSEDLKQWRKERGLKQGPAAKKLQITLRSLQNWEQGTRRPNQMLERVLRARMDDGQ